MVDVRFTNEEVENYIKNKLNKDRVDENDLLLIKELSFNNNVNLKDISRFQNLEILVLKNFELDKVSLKEINKLKKLKVIYFKKVVFKSKIKFWNNIEKIYFDDCISYENIKFRKLNCVEILNSYVNNKVFKNIKKCFDIRINSCKINENIRYNIISKVKVFYLNNVHLETNVFLGNFKDAKIINLDGTTIVGKVEINNMKNEKRYFRIRDVI